MRKSYITIFTVFIALIGLGVWLGLRTSTHDVRKNTPNDILDNNGFGGLPSHSLFWKDEIIAPGQYDETPSQKYLDCIAGGDMTTTECQIARQQSYHKPRGPYEAIKKNQ